MNFLFRRSTTVFLRLVCLTVFWLCLSPVRALAAESYEDIVHVLNRLAYGPRQDDVAWIQQHGLDAWINAQLNPETIPDNVDLDQQLSRFDATHTPLAQLYRTYNLAYGMMPVDQRQLSLKSRNAFLKQDHIIRVFNAVYNPRQLQEVMTEFWFNHFNVFRQNDQIWMYDYENNAIRPHVFGRFRDLLGAVAHHPAMLAYLNNEKSKVPTIDKTGKKRGLNENYARELMELHTLGVYGGYTQADVVALARIFTGWTINRAGMLAGDNTAFMFNPAFHDQGEKVLLGQTFSNDGVNEGERALDLLARHPSTAHHVCYKLVQYFVTEDPPPALVEKLAKVFLTTDGDIRQVLQSLFSSPEFRGNEFRGKLFKSPYQFAISSLRESNAQLNVDNVNTVLNFLRGSSQPIYGWLTPDGYGYKMSDWLVPETLFRRIAFIQRISEIPSFWQMPDQVSQMITTLGPLVSAKTHEQLAGLTDTDRMILVLSAPEAMKR